FWVWQRADSRWQVRACWRAAAPAVLFPGRPCSGCAATRRATPFIWKVGGERAPPCSVPRRTTTWHAPGPCACAPAHEDTRVSAFVGRCACALGCGASHGAVVG